MIPASRHTSAECSPSLNRRREPLLPSQNPIVDWRALSRLRPSGILGPVYRRRLALEWRAAIAVALVAVVGVVLGLLPRPVDDVWLLAGFAAILLVAVWVLVMALRRSVAPPPTMPRRFGYHEATAAEARVRRGEAVDPPELQAAAIAQARRGLRVGHLVLGWFPVMGATWALRIGEGGVFGAFGYIGLAVIALGVSALVWSGVIQRRLNHLEDNTGDVSSPARAEPGHI